MRILKAIKKFADTDRIALFCDEQSMSYRELDNVSEAIAAFILKEFGDDKTPIVLYGTK